MAPFMQLYYTKRKNSYFNNIHLLFHISNIVACVFYFQIFLFSYRELMLLGFVAFIIFFILTGDTITDSFVASFEYADFVMFFVVRYPIFNVLKYVSTSLSTSLFRKGYVFHWAVYLDVYCELLRQSFCFQSV